LASENAVHGLDASATGVESSQNKGLSVDLFDASTQSIPFKDNYFDVVICLETIEHLENPQHCLNEVRRVLKKEGLFLVSIPNPLLGSSLHPYIYPGLFTRKYFQRFLVQNHFEIERIVGWGLIPHIGFLGNTLRTNLSRALKLCFYLVGSQPYFIYWLWIFRTVNKKPEKAKTIMELQAKADQGTGET
ncbi:MAG: class I SAM-dependent methyltransferase, partial [Chloroflexi bacterium]|nr:class I SAM-dependent methyltransferase [Chloroflexota bacterium]